VEADLSEQYERSQQQQKTEETSLRIGEDGLKFCQSCNKKTINVILGVIFKKRKV